MDDDDGPAWYMLGLGTGLVLGLAIAAPDRSDVVVSLDPDDRAVLQSGQPTEALERRICARVREAFADSLDSDENLSFLCPDRSE